MERDYFGEVGDRISEGIMLDINRVIPYKQERDWTCSIACLRTIARTTKIREGYHRTAVYEARCIL